MDAASLEILPASMDDMNAMQELISAGKLVVPLPSQQVAQPVNASFEQQLHCLGQVDTAVQPGVAQPVAQQVPAAQPVQPLAPQVPAANLKLRSLWPKQSNLKLHSLWPNKSQQPNLKLRSLQPEVAQPVAQQVPAAQPGVALQPVAQQVPAAQPEVVQPVAQQVPAQPAAPKQVEAKSQLVCDAQLAAMGWKKPEAPAVPNQKDGLKEDAKKPEVAPAGLASQKLQHFNQTPKAPAVKVVTVQQPPNAQTKEQQEYSR